MTRATHLCALVLSACVAVSDDPEADTTSTNPESGEEDYVSVDPCDWSAVVPVECDVVFEPALDEPLPPGPTYHTADVDIITYADTVEVFWRRKYTYVGDDELIEPLETRNYISSNAGGGWQHQFIHSPICPGSYCPSGAQIGHGGARTHVMPPYSRREAGQWQIPTLDAQTDPTAVRVYMDPRGFAVGPEGRSYLLSTGVYPDDFVWRVWAESVAGPGCHQPLWDLRDGSCLYDTSVSALAVDAAGLVHMTGLHQISSDDIRIVNWRVLPDRVEGQELYRLPVSISTGTRGYQLAIGDFGEVHLCFSRGVGDPAAYYGHGFDSSDWHTVEIEDPDGAGRSWEQGFCKLALANDGTAWLTWHSSGSDAMDPFHVASVTNDVISYEVIDVDVEEALANITVDSHGRPWVVYWARGSSDTLKIAHKDAGNWLTEEVMLPH